MDYSALTNLAAPNTNSLGQVLQNNGGQKVNYSPPSDQTQTDVKDFLQNLYNYDLDPSAANLQSIQSSMQKLNFKLSKFTHGDPSVIHFIPAIISAVGIMVTWRLGLVQQPGKPETYTNPVLPGIISNEHLGCDGTAFGAATLFLNSNFKCMISNAAHPDSSHKPACQSASTISNAAHSNQTLFYPAIGKLMNQLFPNSVVLSPHGMDGGDRMKFLMVDSNGKQFPQDGRPYLPTLFCLAEAPKVTQDRSMSIGSQLPGAVYRKVAGKSTRIPLSPTKKNPHVGVYQRASFAQNTNVPDHIPNGGNCQSVGNKLGRAMHIEFTPTYLAQDSKKMPGIAASLRQATEWWVEYDNSKDPWALPRGFDMSNYGKLFDPAQAQAALADLGEVTAEDIADEDDPSNFADDSTAVPTASATDLGDNSNSLLLLSGKLADAKQQQIAGNEATTVTDVADPAASTTAEQTETATETDTAKAALLA